jgi:hypothetical protein
MAGSFWHRGSKYSRGESGSCPLIWLLIPAIYGKGNIADSEPHDFL